MKVSPAKQVKHGARPKRPTRKERSPSPKKMQVKPVLEKPFVVANVAAPPVANPPVFVRHDLRGPDGSVRPGWEMWIGEHCFGRADSKELLLASFERLQSPPSSFHWREVRNRMPMRGRPRSAGPRPAEASAEKAWDWDKKNAESVTEETSEGFQGLS